MKCPSAALVYGVEKQQLIRAGVGVQEESEVYQSGLVEGQRVEKILLDTGC